MMTITATRPAVHIMLGDLVGITTIVPGHNGIGIVTDVMGDLLEVTDAQHRAVLVPAAGVVIESAVMDAADELSGADMCQLVRYLPSGTRRADAEPEDWAAALAVKRILEVR